MKYLFDVWPRVSSQIGSAGHIFLFADFDGTLTPIIARPSLVYLDDEIRQTLRSIHKKGHITIGIISGRSLRQLKGLVGVKGIIYSGNHGLETEMPDRKGFIPPRASATRPIIRRLGRSLGRRLKAVRGAFVEDKGLTLSLHYRLVEDAKVAEVKRIFAEEVSPYLRRREIRVTHGKKVLEARPPFDWDKGEVINQILCDARDGLSVRSKKILPIYLGDDRTDEDGFLALKDKGIPILVGRKRRSHARYFLKDVDDVKEFLRRVNSLQW